MSTISNAVPTYMSDAALVSEAKSGDHSAFEELCKRHSTKLTRYIRRLLADRSDAEDALQETLFKAFTHLESFEGRSSVLTWLTRIAINTALMNLRRKRGRTVSIDDTGEDSGTGDGWLVRDGAPDPECQLIQKQQEMLLADGIRQLPPLLRAALELRVRYGYSGKQIAEILGISEAAAKSRLMRAQLRLQERGRLRANRPARLGVAHLEKLRA